MEKHKLEQSAMGFMLGVIISHPHISPAECARKAIDCARALDAALKEQPEFQEEETHQFCKCDTPSFQDSTNTFCISCNKHCK